MRGSVLYAFIIGWFSVWIVIFWFVNSEYTKSDDEEELFNNKVMFVYKLIDDTYLKVDTSLDWAKHFVYKFKHNEPYTNLKMKELLGKLPKNSAIIDVGAHVGDTGLYLAKHLKLRYPNRGIRVIMIEPDASKVAFIRATAGLNGLEDYIELINKGVSDVSNSKGSLDVNTKSPGATRLSQDGTGNIEIDTMDKLCRHRDVSMLHIDVEGMEYAALNGARHLLGKAKYVMIELNSLSDRTKERKLLVSYGYEHVPDPKIESEFKNHLFYKPM